MAVKSVALPLFSQALEHVSAAQALDPQTDAFEPFDVESDVDAPQVNEHASEYASDIRALSVARVTEAALPDFSASRARRPTQKAQRIRSYARPRRSSC